MNNIITTFADATTFTTQHQGVEHLSLYTLSNTGKCTVVVQVIEYLVPIWEIEFHEGMMNPSEFTVMH